MNVLVLMTDQHRFDALSCLGNPLARTPNLDRLAAQSVRFENCYTQSPVCAPARHSLATGRYVHAHGVFDNNVEPHPGMVTVAHALKPYGYRRFHLGHMHWANPQVDHGYEPQIDKEHWRQSMPASVLQRWDVENQTVIRRTTGGPSTRTRAQYWGFQVANESIRQLESVRATGEHFLSWTSFYEPHPPFYAPKDFYERIDQSTIRLPEQPPAEAPPAHQDIRKKQEEWKHLTDVERRQIIAAYYSLVALVDDYIGMVLEALDRLNLRKDTIVIWTADHGDQMGEHGMFLKFNMREASVHVPLLISVPNGMPGVRKELVEHVDLLRTICDLVGAKCPESVQGRSLAPLLKGDETPAGWRDAVFSQIENIQMIRSERWKLNVYGGEPGELFNMKNDPREFFNRISDPQYSATVAMLFKRLREWERTTG